jgi:putative intracellular protease/amidase
MSLKDPNVVHSTTQKRVAIVIANPAVSTTTGWPVGFWWSELTHPYYVLSEAGYQLEIFSPRGGKCEADAMSDPRDASGYSSSDLISMGFLSTPKLAALVEATRPIQELEVARFDAIIVAGGQAPMFTFEAGARAPSHVRRVLRGRQARGRALPRHHDPPVRQALERSAPGRGQDRDRLRERRGGLRRQRGVGREVPAARQAPHAVAHRGRAPKLGANYVQAGLWRGFAIRDGNLITGQQNFSGEETARLLLESLGR